MPLGVTFWYHSQKSMLSRFNMLSGSCLTAGGHAALFINQVCIMLVNSFTIRGCSTNEAGFEAQACAFMLQSMQQYHVLFSGVFTPLFSPGFNMVSLNSGLLI